MKQKDLKCQLKTALRNNEAAEDTSRLHNLAEAMVQECSIRNRHRPVGMLRFMKQQIRFVGWKIWLFQVILLLLLTGQFISLLDVSHGFYSRLIGHFVFGCAILTSAVILPVIYRSHRYRMNEVEASTYFSSSRLLLSKLLIVWFGDLIILCSISLFVAYKTATAFGVIALNAFLPFLAASFGIICAMGHFRIKFLLPISMGLYVLLLAGHLLVQSYGPFFLSQSLSVFKFILCIGFAIACLHQLYFILQKPAYTEMQVI